MHGALRNGDLMSEAIIESRTEASYAALEAVARCFGLAGDAQLLRCKTGPGQGPATFGVRLFTVGASLLAMADTANMDST
ncbi:hypothetical protein PspS04_15430 [Pseudomonas sp. S04]|nr:hypothetical protein PspS04_15430 [Pseudomonas sp. S04]QHF34148.1 hypothetical protein PspS19_15435 [Pseudomonas sp. S19]